MSYSVRELVDWCTKFDGKFDSFIEYGMILDKYYIPTRYPNALAPPAVPYKSYTEREAKEAVDYVKRIIGLVREKIGGGELTK